MNLPRATGDYWTLSEEEYSRPKQNGAVLADPRGKTRNSGGDLSTLIYS